MMAGGMLFSDVSSPTVGAQAPLTYPELVTALKIKLPNRSFQTKAALIEWLGIQIIKRRMDKPLTAGREQELRQAGATAALISIVRANSPPLAVQTPIPVSSPPPVNLGELLSRAVDLVKPEYTAEAREAGITGEVKLALELDEDGRVTSVKPLSTLSHGLGERAIEAARRSTFKPATRNFKPARGMGIITYNFKINVLNMAEMLSEANALRQKRDCDRAIAEYSRVINVDGKNAKAIVGRGICHLIKRDYDRAKTDIETAAMVDSTDAEVQFHLAVLYDFMGNHALAASAYAKALSIRPDLDKQPLFKCLYIDRREVKADEARSAADDIVNNCNQAIREADVDLASLVYYKRGIGYRLKADYKNAIADFENVRKLNPTFSAVNGQIQIVYNSRGLEAFNKKDYKKSFDDISLAIQAEPNNSTPYVNRCAVRAYGLKQYEEAIEDCSTAIRLAAGSSMAFNHRGYALEMKKRIDEAAADYESALKLDPGNQTARANLARVRPQVPTLRKPQP